MSAVKVMKAVEASRHPDREHEAGRSINWYPVLGVALVILSAALSYGAIYFHLFDA